MIFIVVKIFACRTMIIVRTEKQTIRCNNSFHIHENGSSLSRLTYCEQQTILRLDKRFQLGLLLDILCLPLWSMKEMTKKK